MTDAFRSQRVPYAPPKPPGPPKTHGTGPGKGAPAGTGAGALPVLKSSHEIQAEANATAWKSIQKMMATLPTFGALDQPYSAQRAAIQPLVDAHRDWLMKAGQYQTQVTNGLAQLLYTGAGAADAGAAGGAAAAGAPLGGGFAGNVSPTAESAIPTALGGSTANYLQSLIPYATAQGIGNVSRVNQNEQDALTKLTDARSQVSGQFGDLSDKAFNSLQGSYFDKYKSELAAIAAGDTAAGKTAIETERARHNRAMEGLSLKRIGAASEKASAATTAASDKAFAAQNKSDRSLTVKALTDARKVYDNLGGVKGSAPGTSGGKQFAVTVTLQAPKPNFGSQPKGQVFTFYGKDINEANRKALHYKATHPPDTSDPTNPGHWDTGAAKSITTGSGTSGSSGVKDRPSEQTRRMRAWRAFSSELTQLNSQLSPAEMQALFRRQFGDPSK